MIDTFKILAEHFSDDTGVKLTVSGTEAKADIVNKEIFLPENISMEMFDVTLATLLHESYHIKHTKGLRKSVDCSSVEGLVLNVLEDIRIDAKILKKYPNGPNLYKNLIEYIDDKNSALGVLPKEVRILRRIILESYNNPIFDKHIDKSPEVQQFFDDNKEFIDKLKRESIKARKTSDLVEPARELRDRVFGKDRPKEQKELEDKIKELDKEDKENTYKRQALAGKITTQEEMVEQKKLQEESRYIYTKRRNEEYKLRKIQEKIASKELEKLKDLEKVSISLENLDKKDLFKVKIAQISIEEDLLEFLKNNQERRLQTDDGKINAAKLPTYFEPTGLFEQRPADKQEKTRIFFLVDSSGSMDGLKYFNAQEALNSISQVIEKGINEYSMDLEYAIYGFNYDTVLVKDFDTPFDKESVATELRPDGGTMPLKTIKHIENIYPEKNNTREIVFFLTDGELQEGYDTIKNELPASKKKWVFIGIDSVQDKDAKEIFGKYNITDSSQIKEILAEAIKDNL